MREFISPTISKILITILFLVSPAIVNFAQLLGYRIIDASTPPVQSSLLAQILQILTALIYFPANFISNVLGLPAKFNAFDLNIYFYMDVLLMIANAYILSSILVFLVRKKFKRSQG